MAYALRLEGHLGEAEVMYRSGLATHERALGEDDIFLAGATAGLAYVVMTR